MSDYLDYFDEDDFLYQGVLQFEATDTSTWLCREKKIWLINSFGNWKTAKYENRRTIYTDYDSFEKACDAILNS